MNSQVIDIVRKLIVSRFSQGPSQVMIRDLSNSHTPEVFTLRETVPQEPRHLLLLGKSHLDVLVPMEE
jgi:hypothetical protein